MENCVRIKKRNFFVGDFFHQISNRAEAQAKFSAEFCMKSCKKNSFSTALITFLAEFYCRGKRRKVRLERIQRRRGKIESNIAKRHFPGNEQQNKRERKIALHWFCFHDKSFSAYMTFQLRGIKKFNLVFTWNSGADIRCKHVDSLNPINRSQALQHEGEIFSTKMTHFVSQQKDIRDRRREVCDVALF